MKPQLGYYEIIAGVSWSLSYHYDSSGFHRSSNAKKQHKCRHKTRLAINQSSHFSMGSANSKLGDNTINSECFSCGRSCPPRQMLFRCCESAFSIRANDHTCTSTHGNAQGRVTVSFSGDSSNHVKTQRTHNAKIQLPAAQNYCPLLIWTCTWGRKKWCLCFGRRSVLLRWIKFPKKGFFLSDIKTCVQDLQEIFHAKWLLAQSNKSAVTTRSTKCDSRKKEPIRWK